MADLGAKARNVAGKCEELIREVLGQAIEVGVVCVVGGVAPRLRLEARELIEGHCYGFFVWIWFSSAPDACCAVSAFWSLVK